MAKGRTYRFISDADDHAFADVLRIYHAAFDFASREPDERLVQELRGEFRLPLRFLVIEAPEVVGFARFCSVAEAGLAILIHIAIDSDRRGGGLGSELLRRVVRECDPLPVFAEVDREGATRRWYEREGFSVVSETYTQPSLRPETGAVPYALFSSRPCANPREVIERFYAVAWELPAEHPYVVEAIRGAVGA